VADEISGAGGTAIAVGVDVTHEDKVQSAVNNVVCALRGVDVLVSNAGIQSVHPVESFPFRDWKKMLAIQS